MNYEVSERRGETLRIGLQEVGEGVYEVTLEGQTLRVDVVRTAPTVYSVIEDGRQFEAVVDERGAHGFDVLVGGRLFHLESRDERSRLLAQSAQLATEGPQTVLAEMPGKVVKVQRAVGELVGAGEGVMIVEAMKMENEITSPIAGRLTELGVAEGDTVETGATLFVVEPVEPAAAD